jgi:hypothetical protein
MMRIRLAAVAMVILLSADIAEAGQVTYLLQNYPADQAGSTLTGFVTTDGKLGTLTSADIIAWSWTVTGPVGPSFTLSGVASTVSDLVATDTQLLLPAAQNTLGEFYLVGPAGSSSAELTYFRPTIASQAPGIYGASNGNLGTAYWITDNPAMGGTDPWVIGVAAASVPEPSSVMLVSLGLTGLLLARTRGRSSRKQSRLHRC